MHLIPTLTGREAPNDAERGLLALPSRLEGIGLNDPTALSTHEHQASQQISQPLTQLILDNDTSYSPNISQRQRAAKTLQQKLQRKLLTSQANNIKATLPDSLQRAMQLSQEKRASSWLTTLPIEEYGFSLHKGAFRDALALRYGWSPPHIPSNCVCGSSFSVEHAVSCPTGGLPTI